MGTGRARLLAVGVVIGSMIGSALALEVWPSSPSPSSNPAIPPSSGGRVVFSLRNDQATTLTIAGFSISGGGSGGAAVPNGCDRMATPVPLAGGGFPVTIAPGAQAQFQVMTAATQPVGWANDGSYSCTFDILTSPAVFPAPTVEGTFHVETGATWDVQPRTMNFGNQTAQSFETQTAVITNYSATQGVWVHVENDTANHFALPCGSGAKLCMLSSPGGGGTATITVRCLGTAQTYGSASLAVRAGSAATDTLLGAPTLLECTGIGTGSGSGSGSGTVVIDTDPITITAPVGIQGVSAPVTVTGTALATYLEILGGDSSFQILCNGGPCTFPAAVPATVTIACIPGGGGSGSGNAALGTLLATGTTGGSDTSTITCTASGTASLEVTPSSLGLGAVAVGSAGSGSITLQNTGDVTLTGVAIALSPDATSFAVSECTPTSRCTLAGQQSRTIQVDFTPQTHGPKATTLTVTTDQGPTDTVGLTGTGVGGVMVVDQPSGSATPPYHLDLGTIPSSQQATGAIAVRNDGNALFTATITGVAAPYTVQGAAGSSVVQNMSASFPVTCGPAAPSLGNEQTWTITAAGAYAGTPQDITVSCSIIDTQVSVDPLMFDFGEVRSGPGEPRTMPVTVTNTGDVAATINSVQLRRVTPGLSLVPSATQTTLAPGASVSAVLSLATDTDTDLTGQFLDISVDDDMLALPVRGKVVTARSRVTPSELDLGTACVGRQVTGTVRLVNGGTATLGIEPPFTDQAFGVTTPGAAYPLALPPGMSVAAEVAPIASTTGPLDGVLTWQDDVPNRHEVPITLEYVDTGTALSPRALDFGILDVETGPRFTQPITLENCDLEPTTVAVRSLRGVRGPIGAWKLEPRVGYSTQLGARGTQAINVTFDPPGRGRYEAELVLLTRTGEQIVRLFGEATGRDFPTGTFYSCLCTSRGVPWGGWPIALAITIVLGARRRRARPAAQRPPPRSRFSSVKNSSISSGLV